MTWLIAAWSAPAGADDGVDWAALETRVRAVEAAEPGCDDEARPDDRVAGLYADLEQPLQREGTRRADFTARIRASVLLHRAATAASQQLLALEACCDDCGSFGAWQLEDLGQTMARTALRELDQAIAELGPRPARGLCPLLPDPVRSRRPVCTTPGPGG